MATKRVTTTHGKRPQWLDKSDDEAAKQVVNLGVQLAPPLPPLPPGPGLAPTLGVTPEELAYLQKGAALFAWYQMSGLGTVREFSETFTKARDLFTIDADIQDVTVPALAMTPPPPISGLRTNFLGWVDTLVKRIKLSPNYNEQLGRQLGIVPHVTPPPASKDPVVKKATPRAGGAIDVEVSRNGAALICIDVSVDGGAYTQAAMLPTSKFTIYVPAGALHNVKIRAQYADASGNRIGEVSADFSVVSLP